MAKKIVKMNPRIPDSLFPDDRKELLINDVAGTREFKKMLSMLNGTYTNDQLEGFLEDLRHWLRPYKVCNAQSPQHSPIAAFQNLSGLKLKMEKMVCLAQFLADGQNFQKLFSLFDQKTQLLWHYIFLHPNVHPKRLNKDLHVNYLKASTSYWREKYTRNNRAFAWFEVIEWPSHYKNDFCCLMPDYLRDLYVKYIFLDVANDALTGEGMTELPDGDLRQTYSNEKGVGGQFNVIRHLTMQDALEIGPRKMTQANVRKVVKQASIPEFFPNPTLKEQSLLAASLAVPAMTSYVLDNRDDAVTKYWESLRHLVNNFDFTPLIVDMLSHIKGIRVSDFVDYSYIVGFYNIFCDAICSLHTDRWYDVDTLLLRLYAQSDATIHHLCLVSADICYPGYMKDADSDEEVHYSDSYDYFMRPGLKSFLALFASLGLLEVAYPKTTALKQQEKGSYAFITHLRVTPLGAFVLGITDAYQAEGVHLPVEYFEADPNRLLIRAVDIDGSNPFEGLLKSIAEPIGSRRYHVTPKAFLAGCSKLGDVDQKWKFITDNVFPHPTSVWEGFYKSMILRCQPLSMPDKSYTIRRIDADDTELHRIFLTDSYLRKHTLRAEGHLLLIENAAMKKVMEKLTDYGYLV